MQKKANSTWFSYQKCIGILNESSTIYICTHVPCLSKERNTSVKITDSYNARVDKERTIRIHYNDIVVAKERIKKFLGKLERLDSKTKDAVKNRSPDIKAIFDNVHSGNEADIDDNKIVDVIAETEEPVNVRRRSTSDTECEYENDEDRQKRLDAEEKRWRSVSFKNKVIGLTARPMYFPIVTGNLDTSSEPISRDDYGESETINYTSSKTNTKNLGFVAGPSGMVKVSGGLALAKTESYGFEFFKNEFDKFMKKGYTCVLGREEEYVRCRGDLSKKKRAAIDLLREVSESRFLIDNPETVIVGRLVEEVVQPCLLRRTRENLRDDDIVDINVFGWQYDKQSQPAVLHLRAKYSKVPFWIVNRYSKDENVIESHLYKTTREIKDGDELSNMSYTVYTTHQEIWKMCKRASTEKMNFKDTEMNTLMRRDSNWYKSVLGEREITFAKKHMKDDPTTLVTIPLPLSLTIAASRDSDLSNWEVSVNDNVETSTLRDDYMGHIYGRLAKLTYLMHKTPDPASSVFCMYNKTGGMNNQLFVWV